MSEHNATTPLPQRGHFDPTEFCQSAARREDRRLRRMTDDELAREIAYWQRRVALAPEEAPAGSADVWPLFCQVSLARYELEARERTVAAARGVAPTNGRAGVPEDVIRDVKRRTDLAELVTRWGLTDLTRRGDRHIGRCPFHEDRTASFYVYTADPDDQHYHCYGCLAHGDVFDLARQHAGFLSFREAVEGLAAACGVDWPPVTPEPVKRVVKSAGAGGITVRRRTV